MSLFKNLFVNSKILDWVLKLSLFLCLAISLYFSPGIYYYHQLLNSQIINFWVVAQIGALFLGISLVLLKKFSIVSQVGWWLLGFFYFLVWQFSSTNQALKQFLVYRNSIYLYIFTYLLIYGLTKLVLFFFGKRSKLFNKKAVVQTVLILVLTTFSYGLITLVKNLISTP